MTDCQLIADQVAQAIRAAIPGASQRPLPAHNRFRAYLGSDLDFAALIAAVIAKRPTCFCELPIPDATFGAIGRCDGVVTRVIRDYDFAADKAATRVDVAFS